MANKIVNEFLEDVSLTNLDVKITASMSWFNSKAQKLFSAKKSAQVKIGGMYMFAYEPLYKQFLPYYDRIPLVVVLEVRKNTIIALNIHYIPPRDRLKIMKLLVNKTNTNALAANSRMIGIKSALKTIKNSTYMIKQYHSDGVKSHILEIPGEMWGPAVTLPTALFKASNEDYAHRQLKTQAELKHKQAEAVRIMKAAQKELEKIPKKDEVE